MTPTRALAADELMTQLERVLPRYQRALREAMSDAEGPDRLTMPQIRCLQAIAHPGDRPATTSSLAELARVTLPTMSSMLDGLAARGLVERRPDPQSRRRVHLFATEQGVALLNRHTAVAHAFHLALIDDLDDASRERLSRGLDELERRLDRFERSRNND